MLKTSPENSILDIKTVDPFSTMLLSQAKDAERYLYWTGVLDAFSIANIIIDKSIQIDSTSESLKDALRIHEEKAKQELKKIQNKI